MDGVPGGRSVLLPGVTVATGGVPGGVGVLSHEEDAVVVLDEGASTPERAPFGDREGVREELPGDLERALAHLERTVLGPEGIEVGVDIVPSATCERHTNADEASLV